MSNNGKVRVGTITLALGLIIGGLVLLFYNLGIFSSLEWFWRLWPVLFIGLGVEYFIRRFTAGDKEISFHVPSVILVIILVLVAGISSAIYSISNNFGDFWHAGFLNGKDYEHSWTWDSDPVPVNLESGRIEINQDTGSIQLEPSADKKLRVSLLIETAGKDPASGKYTPKIESEEGLVRVTFPFLDRLEDKYEQMRVHTTVYIPGGVPVQVKNELGRINGSGLNNSIQADNGLGEIVLNNIQGSIKASTDSGKIDIIDVAGDVTARTNLGQINFRSQDGIAGRYDLKSNIGSVNFRIPSTSDITVDARSELGKISVSGTAVRDNISEGGDNRKQVVLGNGKGGANISVNTGSIDIDVN